MTQSLHIGCSGHVTEIEHRDIEAALGGKLLSSIWVPDTSIVMLFAEDNIGTNEFFARHFPRASWIVGDVYAYGTRDQDELIAALRRRPDCLHYTTLLPDNNNNGL